MKNKTSGVTNAAHRGLACGLGKPMALGGGRDRIFRLVLQEGIAPVLIGVAAGMAVTLGVFARSDSYPVRVSATDPATFARAAVALTFTAVLAMAVPARRASRVDPMIALRQQ